jgi:hypothetical protein
MGVGKWGKSMPALTETFVPSAAVTAWRFVGVTGLNIAVAGARAYGIAAPFDSTTSTDATNKKPVAVITLGVAVLELNGTVAAGDPLTSDASGMGVKWTPGSGKALNAFAREAGVAGDRIAVFVVPQDPQLPAAQAVLVAGTVTVNTPLVTASSIIMLTRGVGGGTIGDLKIGTITAGTSFTIVSASGTDTSTVNWCIVNL